MPRYIDSEDAIYELERAFSADDYGKIIRCISRTPTADVRENVHAKFVSEIIKKENWKGQMKSYFQPNSCSNCHIALTGGENFCPNCGAKMEDESIEDG